MFNLIVGVAQVSVYLRYAQSLKDKRQILKSITQRLKNAGFSVTECGHPDSPKQGSVGFALVGQTQGSVEQALDQGLRLFEHDCEIVQANRQIFDFSDEDEDAFSSVPEDDDKFGEPM